MFQKSGLFYMLQSSLKAVGSKYSASPEVFGSSQYPYMIWEMEYEGFCLFESNPFSKQQGEECCFELKKSAQKNHALSCYESISGTGSFYQKVQFAMY